MKILKKMVAFFDLENMISTIKHLSIILEKETFMLKKLEFKNIKDLYQEKITMSSLLEQYKDLIAKNPLLLTSHQKQDLERFEDTVIKFEEILLKYTTQLSKSRAAHNIIMSSIKKALIKNNNRTDNYNSSGKNKNLEKNYIEPLSVDENI